MGCNGSKSVQAVIADGQTKDENAETRPVTPQPVPPSIGFEIPFNDDVEIIDASIVKKHPPKRLQRLEEQQQNTAPISLEELQEKQQEAENRRQQFLQLRAQSAKRKYAMRNNNNQDEMTTEDDDDKSVTNGNDVVGVSVIDEGEVKT